MRPPLTRLRHSPLARLLVFGLLVLAITVPPYAPTVEAQADETLVSQGKLASASSSDSSGIYGPEHAVDDDSYRPWIADAAAPLPQWWMVDLGRSYALSRLTYHLYWEDFECANLYDLTIEASVDGQAWFQLLTRTEAFGFGEAPLAGTGRYVRLTFTGARNYCLGTPVVAGIRDIGIYGGPSNLALTLTDSAEQPISALALQDGWPTRNAASGALANPIRVTAVVNDQTATGGEYTLILRIASTQGTARFYAYDFPMVEQGCMVRDVEPYGDGVNLNSFVQQTIACTPHCI